MYDRPQRELDSIHKTINNDIFLKPVELQHNLDVIAFQDMFKGSQLAKDSSFVADYNEMVGKTKVPIVREGVFGEYVPDYKKMQSTLNEMVKVGELEAIKQNPILKDGKDVNKTGFQYIIDSVAHNKIFEKYEILDSTGMKNFKRICNKVRP